MQIPIPDDWGGETWECAQITWPDSPQWKALLLGFLSQVTRGRYWDAATGSITDVQSIGWEIWERNIPLISCEGLPGPILNGTDGTQGGAAIIMEEGEMGQVVTDVTIEGGQIKVWFGPCCSKVLGPITASLVTADIGDDPLVPTGGTAPDYFGCAKAAGIVQAVDKVLNTAYIAISSITYPWQYLGYVEEQVGYNLNDKWVTALIVDWLAYGLVVDPDQVFSANDADTARAKLETVFADDAAGVPDDETYQAVKAAFHSSNLIYDGLVMTAIAALGRENLDTIAKLSAADETAECTGGIGWPVPTQPYTWIHKYDFRDSLHGFVDEQSLWVEGFGLYNPAVNWAEYLGGVHKDPVATGGNMSFMAFRVKTWPINPGGGGVSPRWFNVDADNYYDAAWIDSPNWIVWSPASPPLIDGEIGAGDYQFSQTDPGDPSGVSQWYELLIAGTGTDPFPLDP